MLLNSFPFGPYHGTSPLTLLGWARAICPLPSHMVREGRMIQYMALCIDSTIQRGLRFRSSSVLPETSGSTEWCHVPNCTKRDCAACSGQRECLTVQPTHLTWAHWVWQCLQPHIAQVLRFHTKQCDAIWSLVSTCKAQLRNLKALPPTSM